MGSVRQDPDSSQLMLEVMRLDKSLPETSGQSTSADWELLIRNVLEAVRARRTTTPQRSQERELECMLRDTLPVGSITEDTTSPPVLQPVGGAIPLTNNQLKRGTCFSCRLQGHGVNQCLRMDVPFPYLLPGWSVDVRNGQYRASRICRVRQNCPPGNEQKGQPPEPSIIVTHLTPVGGSVFLGDTLWLGDNRRAAPMVFVGPRMPRAFQLWGASLLLKKNDVIIRFRMAA